jgi:glycosyltransferase involved in cell wall biosynthesis
MKFVVITSTYPRFPDDNISPFVQSLSEAVARLGHRAYVLAPYDPRGVATSKPGDLVEVIRFRYVVGNRFHIMGHAKALKRDQQLRTASYLLAAPYLISAIKNLNALAKHKKIEVIHAHWVIPNGIAAALVARIRRLPLVLTLHGSDLFVAGKNAFFSILARMAFVQAHTITVCSEDLRDKAIRLGAKRSQIKVIPWGANPDLFLPRDPTLLRQSLEIQSADQVILALGRVVPKKGFQYLIQALPHLIEHHPAIKLVIAGDGDYLYALKDLASQTKVMDWVRFPGAISWSDVPTYLHLADIFVAPSVTDSVGNQDGLPTVILEAMAAGKPIIASRLAGIPLVLQEGVNGFLVPEKEPAALARAINLLLTDERKRLDFGMANLNSVRDKFNWMAVAREFETIFQEAIANHRSHR